MNRIYLVGIVITIVVLLLALCGLAIIVGDGVREALQPMAHQAAEARISAAARCAGLIVVGCNIDQRQEIAQEQEQQTPGQKQFNWLPVAATVVLLGICAVVGASLD